MKKLFKNIREDSIKSILLGLALLISSHSFGQPQLAVAISKVEGRAFYSHDGKTKIVKVGMHLPSGSDIFTEEGTQLFFNDYYNHQFVLSGSGHVTVSGKTTMLKSGYLWVQTLGGSTDGMFHITTANSEVDYNSGESIISFDPFSGKTQILVLKGEYLFKNILYKESYVGIREGRFSFISNDVNNGLPRKPTPIGYSSFQKITGLFRGVKTLEDQESEQRMAQQIMPAKQPMVRNAQANVPKQDMGFEQAIEQKRVPSSEPVKEMPKVDTEKLLNNYLSELAKERPEHKEVKKVAPASVPVKVNKPAVKKKKRTYKGYKRNSVKVNIYGASVRKKSKSKARRPASASTSLKKKTHVYGTKKKNSYKRGPASLGDMVPEVYDRKSSRKTFESGLRKEYKLQKRHSNEMNSLINKLQSVDMDYNKDY